MNFKKAIFLLLSTVVLGMSFYINIFANNFLETDISNRKNVLLDSNVNNLDIYWRLQWILGI
ncbi:hypothetical protein KWV16_15400 [Clostridioides difficile]|nr:hypothetical protein [Clostridioides difficile]